MTKTCTRCKQAKPLGEYHKDKHSKDGAYSMCKVCAGLKQKTLRSNPDWEYGKLEHRRWREIKYHYGISKSDWEEMYNAQDGSCKVCSTTENYGGRYLAVDHLDTTEGKYIRGLLCNHCNTAIGKLKENDTLTAKASVYVHTSGNINPDFWYQTVWTVSGVDWTSGVL